MDNANKRRRRFRRPANRKLVQLYSALLYNAGARGFISGEIYKGRVKYACVPGLNCYSCPGAVGACPLGAIQNALASAGHRAGWYVLGIIMLYGVILGRTVCGWLCPMGWMQELLHRIPTPKLGKHRVARSLTWLKYVLLAVFVIALPLGYGLRDDLPLPAFCKYICPAGTFEGAVGLLANPNNGAMFGMLGLLFTRKFVIMLAVGLACVFCYRAFCRFLCPLGAIYGLFNRFNIVGVKVDEGRCNRCGACVRGCGMDVRRVGDRECIQCGRCMEACAQGAISVRAGRITLMTPAMGCEDDGPDATRQRRKLGRVLWGAALAVLCFALVWFNFLDPAVRNTAAPGKAVEAEAEASSEQAAVKVPAETGEPAAAESVAGDGRDVNPPPGHEVGQLLPDFSLECYDGSVFRLSDQRGKIVVINLWATYCAPCKRELPWFSALYEARGGDLAMLAVHPSLVTDDPEAYLAGKGYAMPFATDTEDDAVNTLVGGTGTLPQTIVLNRRGEVVYNAVGSVTPEMLETLVEQADR